MESIGLVEVLVQQYLTRLIAVTLSYLIYVLFFILVMVSRVHMIIS